MSINGRQGSIKSGKTACVSVPSLCFICTGDPARCAGCKTLKPARLVSKSPFARPFARKVKLLDVTVSAKSTKMTAPAFRYSARNVTSIMVSRIMRPVSCNLGDIVPQFRSRTTKEILRNISTSPTQIWRTAPSWSLKPTGPKVKVSYFAGGSIVPNMRTNSCVMTCA